MYGRPESALELRSYDDAARTEGEVLWFTTAGFEHNSHDVMTCDFENALYPDLYFQAEMVLVPTS